MYNYYVSIEKKIIYNYDNDVDVELQCNPLVLLMYDNPPNKFFKNYVLLLYIILGTHGILL
jgi:hypothetical protein